MDKKASILTVNQHLGHRLLHERNTSFSNVNVSKAVWWLNIKPEKFKRDLHILLAKEDGRGLIWLRIEANSFGRLDKTFRIRLDKDAVDLEIASTPSQYLRDVKSGGTGYNFAKHIEHEW